ncbi:hypothetical protein CFC21_044248 [Triticum aestivum]|uniref:Ubiquitin-like protease family profile domain-containing protein n=2 Tax=Triticum aestivum TaxID=4565 RepID=A0A3B6FX82_WHEAT|nr:hypothetical protein CFC21_044248 [Triticum aestivum]
MRPPSSPSPIRSYPILRPPSLNSPSPVCLAMRQAKSRVLLPTAPPGFSSPRLHSSRGQDLVGDLGSHKDDGDQVSQDDVGIAPDLASVDLSAGDTPRPSEQLMLLAQPSYKMKNVVPVVPEVATSTSHNSHAIEQTACKGKGQTDADVVTSKVVAIEEVITVEDAEEQVQMDVDPPSPRRNQVAMDTDHETLQKNPEIQSDASVHAPTSIVQASPSALVDTAPRPATPPTIPCVLYPVASLSVDEEVSASKGAMIQVELMNSKLNDALNTSEVLKAPIQEEVESLRAELEKEKKKNEKLEKEKAIMGECQNKYPQKRKGGEANSSFKDHLPPPKISNHSTYNVRDKTSKGMLDVEIFELDLWTGIHPEKKSDYAYLDSMWFDMYIIGKHKSKVLKWVKAKKIFTRRYVFVPIVYWGHWSLLVLCNFGETNYLGTPKGPRILLLDSLRTTQPKRLPSVINRFHSKVEMIVGALFDPEVLQNLEDIRKAILLYQEKQDATITE